MLPQLAERIHAHVLIYGVVVTDEKNQSHVISGVFCEPQEFQRCQ